MYYRGANAALLLYDITNQVSFQDVRGWLKGEPFDRPEAFNSTSFPADQIPLSTGPQNSRRTVPQT
jgi:hypothetical protein